MTWTCASQVADNCVETDLFDPPFSTGDNAAICGPCARELGICDPT
jgi:hypothetical protein